MPAARPPNPVPMIATRTWPWSLAAGWPASVASAASVASSGSMRSSSSGGRSVVTANGGVDRPLTR